MTDLIPKSIAEVTALARVLAASGAVSALDVENAERRAKAVGCTLAQALEADMFVKIMAGATRGIDPATSLGYFGVYGGAVRVVREGPLALVIRAGSLEEIDERLIDFSQLQDLEFVASGPPREEGESDAEFAHALAENDQTRRQWAARDDSPQKLKALQDKAHERIRMLGASRTDGTGYEAAICAVRRAGVWSVGLFDLDHAEARDLLRPENEWWTRFRPEALKYAARQPLLREVFADVLGGLAVDDAAGARPGTPAIASPAAPTSDDEGDLREGVSGA